MKTIAQLIDAFLSYSRNMHKAKTAKTYTERLKPMKAFCGQRSVGRLNHELLSAWISYASRATNGKPFSNSTVRMAIAITKRLLRFAVQRKYLKHEVPCEFALPKDTLRERIPTRREQRAILAAAPKPFKRIYQALRMCGARPGELARANVEDYDRKRGLIILDDHKERRATGRVRTIHVGHRLRSLLRFAIRERQSGPIFLTSLGNRWSVETLSHKFATLRDRAGLSKDLCLYCATRHEHGTRMTARHGIFAAAKSLGHASIESTMRYAHLSDKKLREYQDDL